MALKRFTAEEQRLKKCERERLRRIANPERKKAQDAAYRAANREKTRVYMKAYFSKPENIERNRARAKAYYEANREKYIAISCAKSKAQRAEYRIRERVYRSRNRESIRAGKRKRYHTVPNTKLAVSIRNRLARLLRGVRKHKHTLELLGCSVEEALEHIASLFKPGMSWQNWSYRGWHLDHVKPLICFDLTDPKQLEEACHFTNLQPLWMKDNLSKSRKPPRPIEGAAAEN